jgi:hypothetical protein
MTTPAKPYVPKDDPSTPAVVISEAALAGTTSAAADRARITQTLPAQHRSSPAAAPMPVPAAIASSPSSALDDTYPPARRRGGKLPLLLGAITLAAVGVLAAVKLTGAGADKNPAASPAAAEQHPAPPPPPVEPAVPTPTEPAPVAATAPAPEPPAAKEEPEAPLAVAAKRGKSIRKPSAPAPRKPAARVEAKTEPKPASAPATEPAPAPAPAPTPKPKGGVIVRETPF